MTEWLPSWDWLPDLSAWQEWPFHWIALGLLLAAGVLLVLKRITTKGSNMAFWDRWTSKPAPPAAVAAPAPSSDASEIAALRAQVTALLAQISELTKLLHQSAPVQMTPAAPAPSLPQPPPPAAAPVAPSPAAAPAFGGGTLPPGMVVGDVGGHLDSGPSRGSFPIGDLTLNDIKYLWWRATRGDIGGDRVFTDSLKYNTRPEVDRVINMGKDYGADFNPATYSNPRLQQVVDALPKG